jgi:N-acetyl-anhydromuramyl-L-alanine amidase AmpD
MNTIKHNAHSHFEFRPQRMVYLDQPENVPDYAWDGEKGTPNWIREGFKNERMDFYNKLYTTSVESRATQALNSLNLNLAENIKIEAPNNKHLIKKGEALSKILLKTVAKNNRNLMKQALKNLQSSGFQVDVIEEGDTLIIANNRLTILMPDGTVRKDTETNIEIKNLRVFDLEAIGSAGAPPEDADDTTGSAGAPPEDADDTTGSAGAPPEDADDTTGSAGAPPENADDTTGSAGAPPEDADDTTGSAGAPPEEADDTTGSAGAPPEDADDTTSSAGAPPEDADDTTGSAGAPPEDADDTTGSAGALPEDADDTTGSAGAPPEDADDTTGSAGAPPEDADDTTGSAGAPPEDADDTTGSAGAPPEDADDTTGSAGAPPEDADDTTGSAGAPPEDADDTTGSAGAPPEDADDTTGSAGAPPEDADDTTGSAGAPPEDADDTTGSAGAPPEDADDTTGSAGAPPEDADDTTGSAGAPPEDADDTTGSAGAPPEDADDTTGSAGAPPEDADDTTGSAGAPPEDADDTTGSAGAPPEDETSSTGIGEVEAQDYSQLEGVTEERLAIARDALSQARKEIKDTIYPALQREVARLGALRPRPDDYSDKNNGLRLMQSFVDNSFDENDYLPLMIKESYLDTDAISRSQARGLFQVRAITEKEIEKYYDYTASDIFDAKENAIVGILYLHRCRNHYAEQSTYNELSSNEDKDLLAHAIYNVGPTDMRKIWDQIGTSTYEEFEGKISSAMVTQLGDTSTSAYENVEDAEYGVTYRQYAGVTSYLAHESTEMQDKLVVEGIELPITIQKGGEFLRYARTIEAIEALEATAVIDEPVDDTPEDLTEIDLEDMVYEKIVLEVGQSLWTPSNSLRKKALEWGIEGFEAGNEGVDYMDREAERQLLLKIIIDFNNDYGSTPISDIEEMPVGLEILIPNQIYINAWMESVANDVDLENLIKEIERRKREEDETGDGVDVPTLDAPPEIPDGRRAYVDVSMEASGIEQLSNDYGLDLTPQTAPANPQPGVVYRNPHGLSVKNRSGREIGEIPNREKTHIILHSTNVDGGTDRGLDSTMSNYRAHYIVSREGVVYLIRDPEDNMDHAGRVTNRRSSKAMWDGDGLINDKSIGIEVATQKGEEWNDAQYEAVRALVHSLGGEHDIPASQVLTHSQVACGYVRSSGRYFRVAKPDPLNVDWAQLDLPNNYMLVDYDVLNGMEANTYSTNGNPDFNGADIDLMFSGILRSRELANDTTFSEYNATIRAAALAEWRDQIETTHDIETYTVAGGDSLGRIASRYSTTAGVIQKYNGLDSTVIHIGDELEIPVERE